MDTKEEDFEDKTFLKCSLITSVNCSLNWYYELIDRKIHIN